MAKRSEASIQKSVVDYARKLKFIAIKLSTNGARGSAGWPDYQFFPPPGGSSVARPPFFIEFKAPGSEPTPLQWLKIKLLRSLGYEVFIVDDALIGKGIIWSHL